MALPIYYINLDRRPDRRDHIETQLARLGLASERISAVAIASISPDDLARHCNPRRIASLSPSQYACSLSHLVTWRRFLAQGSEWALVLEDDAVLSDRLVAFLAAWPRSEAAQSFDLVHIEATARPARVLPATTQVGDTQLRRYCSTQWGSAAYLIRRRAAEALLKSRRIFDGPIDQVLFRPYVPPGRDLALAVADPALAVQLDKLQASTTARGNLTPVHAERAAAPWIGMGRFLATLPPFLASVAYHRRHRQLGVRRVTIPFDTADGLLSGSKNNGYGVEIRD